MEKEINSKILWQNIRKAAYQTLFVKLMNHIFEENYYEYTKVKIVAL